MEVVKDGLRWVKVDEGGWRGERIRDFRAERMVRGMNVKIKNV